MQNQNKISQLASALNPSGSGIYLIVGGGNLARHLSVYLSEHFQIEVWNRREFDRHDLTSKMKSATHLLLAISDSAIESFYFEIAPLWGSRPRLHFSGAVISDQIPGAHPLSPFGLIPLNTYSNIPFVCDAGFDFRGFFPGLRNPYLEISREDKVKYHALVSLAANFTTHLWQSAFQEMQKLNFNTEIGPELLYPLLQNSLNNFCHLPYGALTGAVARKDFQAVASHLKALSGSPLHALYFAFVQQRFPEFQNQDWEEHHAESNGI